MNFASLAFWLALAAGFLVLSILRLLLKRPEGFDRGAFVFLSLFLLGSESLETVAIFLWVAGIGYLGLKKRIALWILAPLMLAPLSYYKYSGFLAGVFTGEDVMTRLLIPMGISFYTFQILSFVIDHRRSGEGPPPILDYLNFASFFPQIVAGPIERGHDLLPQVKKLRFCLSREAVEDGLPWIVLGLFFKLALAENFALLDQELNSRSGNALKIWLEAGFFGCRIYFDFAGYSFIALGLARFFKIELTLNFRSPYLTRNLQDFWRRWHVTLSRWFRDYVYIPLGGSRTRYWLVAVLVVFGVSGLWHGAGWNFIIWGLLHGMGVVSCALLGKRRLPGALAWAVTTVFVLLSWLFFKESNPEITLAKLQQLAKPQSYQLGSGALIGIFASIKSIILLAMMVVLSGAVFLGEWWSLRRGGTYYELFLNRWIQLLLIAGIFFLAPTSESPFIYFNF